MGRAPVPSDYVRRRLSSELIEHMRRRIAEVHAGAFAMTIDHVEFLRRQSGLAT
jgi:hypothetical protein